MTYFSVVPIFGVLKHKDKINENDEDYKTLEKIFQRRAGSTKNPVPSVYHVL